MKMYYFAYGSNMNLNDLDRWCKERGYSPVNIGPNSYLEVGILRGYRLIFNHYSKSRKGGTLNITEYGGGKVCGVLFTLTEEDFQKIRDKESGYEPHPVNIDLIVGGGVVSATTFKAQDSRELYPPTEEYLEIVLAGARNRRLVGRCLEPIRVAARQAREAKHDK